MNDVFSSKLAPPYVYMQTTCQLRAPVSRSTIAQQAISLASNMADGLGHKPSVDVSKAVMVIA